MADSQQRGEPPLVTRDFVLIVVAHFLQALGYSSMLLLPLYLHHVGASRTEIGLAMGCAAVAGLAPPDVNVELDVMRVYASSLGLGVLGAIGGAFTGAVGGMALATTLVAARRWR